MYYNYSLPWTVLGMHMRTVRTGIYAPGIWENSLKSRWTVAKYLPSHEVAR